MAHDHINKTQAYYDSQDADYFYHEVWGGEDIHIGIYRQPDESIMQASRNTVKLMAHTLQGLNASHRVLDIGSGYGGSARYLASNFDCHVTCLNLSTVENQRNILKNREQGLAELIDVVSGNFENMAFDDGLFDLVWSQDAILHSNNKASVFSEVSRVLKPDGRFIFTDPMQADEVPDEVLKPILNRIHLEQMGSVRAYKNMASNYNLQVVKIQEMPQHLNNHYSAILNELNNKENDLLAKGCTADYITQMKNGLNHWVKGAINGWLNWGIFLFIKKG